MSAFRRFVIGDIHGHYAELMRLFYDVNFQYKKDLLISLGDLVDRGPHSIQVIEELKKVDNFIHILGNHDDWCYRYLKFGEISAVWQHQGGKITLAEYVANPNFKESHCSFFENAKLFFIDEDSRLFVHGGYNCRIPFNIQTNDKETLIWDRSLVCIAMEYAMENKRFSEFSEIYVGHTATQFLGFDFPKQISNVWMLDTGVFHSGKLSLMNIETKEYYQT